MEIRRCERSRVAGHEPPHGRNSGRGGAGFAHLVAGRISARRRHRHPGGAPCPGARAADDVPPEQQVLILSRALVYDDNFKDRVGTEVRVAILSKPGNAASETSAAAMLKAWKGVGNLKLAGLPLRVSALPWKDAASFGPGLATDAIDVLYVCPGLEANLVEILELTRKRQVITVGSREDHVKKGVSLGVFLVERPSHHHGEPARLQERRRQLQQRSPAPRHRHQVR